MSANIYFLSPLRLSHICGSLEFLQIDCNICCGGKESSCWAYAPLWKCIAPICWWSPCDLLLQNRLLFSFWNDKQGHRASCQSAVLSLKGKYMPYTLVRLNKTVHLPHSSEGMHSFSGIMNCLHNCTAVDTVFCAATLNSAPDPGMKIW